MKSFATQIVSIDTNPDAKRKPIRVPAKPRRIDFKPIISEEEKYIIICAKNDVIDEEIVEITKMLMSTASNLSFQNY